MKTLIITALTALTLTAGIASAATNAKNERPDGIMTAVADKTVQLRAKAVLTSVELSRADLDADAVVTITAFPTISEVARANEIR